VHLQLALGRAIQDETLRRAEAHWLRDERRPRTADRPGSTITLRLAEARDGRVLEALASVLDFRDTVLVAAVDGQVVGACSLEGTSSFRPPSDPLVKDLLELRAAQLRRIDWRATRFPPTAIRSC